MSKIKMSDLNIQPSCSKKEIGTERTKLDSVVSKDALKRTKKPLSKKLMKQLFNADDISDMKDYILTEVILPGIGQFGMNALSVIFLNRPLDPDFFSGGKKKKTYGRASYTSYYEKKREKERKKRRYYDDEDDDVDYREIVLKYQDDAEKIVDEMYYRIDEEGSVSVAELFDMIDVAGEASDNDYGWTRKGDIGVKKVAGGFLIDVNEAKRL